MTVAPRQPTGVRGDAGPARPTATGIFDLADQDLGVGDVFRWPCGSGAQTWRIADVLDPHVDELTQRVRAVPVRRAS